MQREVLQNGGEVYEELHARQWFSQTQSASCVGGKAESGGEVKECGLHPIFLEENVWV